MKKIIYTFIFLLPLLLFACSNNESELKKQLDIAEQRIQELKKQLDIAEQQALKVKEVPVEVVKEVVIVKEVPINKPEPVAPVQKKIIHPQYKNKFSGIQTGKWTKEMSPILIENTVQIPEGEILEIQKEVEIVCDENKNDQVACFLVHGNLKVNQKVKIEANNRILISILSSPGGFIDIDSAEISGAFKLFGGDESSHGRISLSIANTILSNIRYASTINRIRNKDLIIRNNTFSDASGFIFGENGEYADKVNIFVEKNKFISKHSLNPNAPWLKTKWIKDGVSIKYNSFLSGSKVIEVSLSAGRCAPCNNIDLSQNFWNTNDVVKINGYILDYNDNIALGGPLNITPILQEPHSDVGHNH